jgi:hypothetical protein
MLGAKCATVSSRVTIMGDVPSKSILILRGKLQANPSFPAASGYPVKVAISIGLVCIVGAAPIAMAYATSPSMRPVERFFGGLRLPASSMTTVVLATHMPSSG